MADPLRHRQTKGAATDMVDLTPPRHIPTLPRADHYSKSNEGPVWGHESASAVTVERPLWVSKQSVAVDD